MVIPLSPEPNKNMCLLGKRYSTQKGGKEVVWRDKAEFLDSVQTGISVQALKKSNQELNQELYTGCIIEDKEEKGKQLTVPLLKTKMTPVRHCYHESDVRALWQDEQGSRIWWNEAIQRQWYSLILFLPTYYISSQFKKK